MYILFSVSDFKFIKFDICLIFRSFNFLCNCSCFIGVYLLLYIYFIYLLPLQSFNTFCLLHRVVDPNSHHVSRKRSMSTSSKDHHLGPVAEEGEADGSSSESDSETASTVPHSKRDDLVNPYWIEDPDLRKGEVEFLSSAEIQFWKDLLEKYLYPIDEDKNEKVRLVSNLLVDNLFRIAWVLI